MKTRVFRGKDEQHLETQIWNWMLSYPDIVIKERHAIERLELNFVPTRTNFAPKGPVQDALTRKIDYED
jgi:hypothetical protein